MRPRSGREGRRFKSCHSEMAIATGLDPETSPHLGRRIGATSNDDHFRPSMGGFVDSAIDTIKRSLISSATLIIPSGECGDNRLDLVRRRRY